MDSSQGVYMDVDAVRGMAKNFGTIGETLQGVNKTLEALSNILRASAFVGLIGLAALAAIVDIARPQIEEMAEKCEELNDDLGVAADAYERGDAAGATRFH